MAADPEIVLRDIRKTNGIFVCQHADTVEQHHFMTVRIEFHDSIAIDDHCVQVK